MGLIRIDEQGVSMKSAIASVVALFAAGLAFQGSAQSQDYCPNIVKYVCAVKGGKHVTYVNSCFARAEAATNIVLGKCDNESTSQMQFCPEQLIPVCAVRNGVPATYGNACIAISDGVTILHKGNC
jgi:hypothetical protein